MADIKIVSEQSKADIAKRRAGEDLNYAIHELTANLLRVIAGGGRDYELYRQFLACADGIRACSDLDMRPYDIPLSVRFEGVDQFKNASPADLERWSNDGTMTKALAIELIITGSLRFVASKLAQQPTHMNAAKAKITDGIRYWIDGQAESRHSLEIDKPAKPAKRRRRRKAGRKPQIMF